MTGSSQAHCSYGYDEVILTVLNRVTLKTLAVQEEVLHLIL